jgi:hypothetical protein
MRAWHAQDGAVYRQNVGTRGASLLLIVDAASRVHDSYIELMRFTNVPRSVWREAEGCHFEPLFQIQLEKFYTSVCILLFFKIPVSINL